MVQMHIITIFEALMFIVEVVDVNAGALAEQHGIFQYIRRRINIYTHSLDMRLTLQLLRSFSHLQSYKVFCLLQLIFRNSFSFYHEHNLFAEMNSLKLGNSWS